MPFPTLGMPMADVKRLIDILHRLVDEGHTVVGIEHHPEFLAQGTPEKVATHKISRTTPFLKDIL